MLTGFPLTNIGIFYPDLFPGFQEYINVATPVVSDVSEVTVSFYKNKEYIHRHMDAKSKFKALIYETKAPVSMHNSYKKMTCAPTKTKSLTYKIMLKHRRFKFPLILLKNPSKKTWTRVHGPASCSATEP